MRLRPPLLALLWAAAHGAGVALAAAGVTVEELPGARIVEAALPGRALDLVAAAGGVAVLIAPADEPEGPRSLLRLDLSEEGSLVELAGELPAETDSVGLLDLRGDGRPELIVGEPGRIHALGLPDASGHRPRLLLEAPEIDLGELRRRGLVRADPASIALPRLGRLELYRGAAMELAEAFDLPVRAKRERAALLLTTPPVRPAEGPGAPVFAVGPEVHGSRRLLTTLIDPAADPEGRAVETWARLPAAEKVAQSWVLSIDGRPALAVATLAADKLGIFEKKKLRVFPLLADRTRAGTAPALEVETATRHWFGLGVHVADLDGDGRDDLAVVQPDGLGGKKLALEAWRGQGNGGFYRTPRRSVVAAPAAWVFGRDVSGDRVPDLVTLDGDGRLEVFRGLAAHRKSVVEIKAAWSLEAPAAARERRIAIRVGDDEGSDDSDDEDRIAGHLEVADLDGDGRGEVLLRLEDGARTVLRVVELR